MASIPSNSALETTRPAVDTSKPRWAFPRWANYLLPLLVIAAVGAGLYVPTLVYVGASPMATDVGYAPDQPIKYSHALHVGQLGMDCRFCHTTVENAAFAAVPPTQTCMNCHAAIRSKTPDGSAPNPNLAALYASWKSGTPVQWKKIHDLPDYAYFNHSAHVNKGVSCVTCHGRIDQMETVYQAKPLNMAWCLECHRQPEKYLRPREEVFNLGWTIDQLKTTHPDLAADIQKTNGTDGPVTQEQMGLYLKQKYQIKEHNFMTSCSTCHR
ncbi:MAG: cytochrome c3 family protein [Tepidisphaeraceae bacterium]